MLLYRFMLFFQSQRCVVVSVPILPYVLIDFLMIFNILNMYCVCMCNMCCLYVLCKPCAVHDGVYSKSRSDMSSGMTSCRNGTSCCALCVQHNVTFLCVPHHTICTPYNQYAQLTPTKSHHPIHTRTLPIPTQKHPSPHKNTHPHTNIACRRSNCCTAPVTAEGEGSPLICSVSPSVRSMLACVLDTM